MAEFFFGAVKTDQHPAFMEIRGLGGGTCVDQHRGGLDTVGLDANTINAVAKAGEHFATDLPAIKLGGGVSGGGASMGSAEFIHK